MKVCPICGKECADDAKFCVGCGTAFSDAQSADTAADAAEATDTTTGGSGYTQQPYGTPPYAQQYVYVDPTDHTSEFDPKDISDNKVLAMAPYLLGWLGIIVALLAVNNSPYAAFHVKQAMKIEIISTLSAICAAVLCFTFIVPIAAGIFAIVLFVVKIICFFQVCGNKAKEPAIVKNFGFLK